MSSDILYHYTSLDAFVNMVKGKEFWLSDITKSNDPLEGTYILKALKDAYNYLYADKQINEDQFWLAHWTLFRFNESSEKSERLVDFYAAASFCIPNHELTMLRSYADNGKGVALGISKDVLQKLPKHIPELEFRQIEYLSEKEIVEREKKFWLKLIGTTSIKKSDITDAVLEPFIEAVRKEYSAGYFLKNDINRDEEEYRLLYHLDSLFDLYVVPSHPDVPEKIDFLAKDGDLKAYYRIPLGSSNPLGPPSSDLFYFDTILIGPQCGASKYEIRVFLKRHNILVRSIGRISWVQMR